MSSEPVNVEKTPTNRPPKRMKPSDSPDVLSKTVDVCGHCKKKCGGEGPLNEAIQCDLCATWVHASCEGISPDDYKSLTIMQV